jgi:hypothetical protein
LLRIAAHKPFLLFLFGIRMTSTTMMESDDAVVEYSLHILDI